MEAVARWFRHPRMILGILALMGASLHASDGPFRTEEAVSMPMSTREQKEACVRRYVQCKQECWVGRCDDCLHKCTAQGEWDFGMCYPRRAQ
jgi:hypothetical protein